MIEAVIGLHYPFVAHKNTGRLLLRPHGRSEGRVYRIKNTWYRRGPTWYQKKRKVNPFDSSKMYWPTRAQAAQAVRQSMNNE